MNAGKIVRQIDNNELEIDVGRKDKEPMKL